MFHRRSIAIALGLLAGFGFQGVPATRIAAAPPPLTVTGRRVKAPRRAPARAARVLPGKKGQLQKHQGKACRHAKPARQRRRAARMKRG